MGKPLLTDEIIERANRGESFDQTEPFTENEDREATKIIETSPRDAVKHEEKRFFDSLKKEDEKDQMVYKSGFPMTIFLQNAEQNTEAQ